MSTIYDVAALAGVSPATVSRVFNGSKVTPRLEQAVRDAARQLSFVPNQNARRLRMQRSQIITLMIPDIENPFFTAISRAVEDVARAQGYSVTLCNTDDDEVKFAEYLRAVVSDPVAGIIATVPSPRTSLAFAVERGVPVVAIDRTAPLYPVDSVVADSEGGARDTTARLFAAGYSRIGCITGPEGVETADARWRGWDLAWRQERAVPGPAELVRRVPYSVRGGEDALRSLLALPDPPDAVFAANNKLSAGVLRVLFDLGLDPAHFGVGSLGGLPLVTWRPRGVLVSHLPARAMGATAARLLLSRINGEDLPEQHLRLDIVQTDDQDGDGLME